LVCYIFRVARAPACGRKNVPSLIVSIHIGKPPNQPFLLNLQGYSGLHFKDLSFSDLNLLCCVPNCHSNMQVLARLAVSVSFIARLALAQDHGEEASREMGPVAFMWPPDRLWGADFDNHAPCGSAASVTNRTIFPLCKSLSYSTLSCFPLTMRSSERSDFPGCAGRILADTGRHLAQ